MKPNEEIEILSETPFLRLVQRGRWSFVQRQKNVNVVGIVAITDDRKLILVEQFRPPMNARVIELPAGLAGDIAGQENESLETAARRELLEETGYEAKTWTPLPTVVSSAGLTDERVSLFLAKGLTKTGLGGGDESEDITMHTVALDELDQWLSDAAEKGIEIDSRVYGAMYWSQV